MWRALIAVQHRLVPLLLLVCTKKKQSLQACKSVRAWACAKRVAAAERFLSAQLLAAQAETVQSGRVAAAAVEEAARAQHALEARAQLALEARGAAATEAAGELQVARATYAKAEVLAQRTCALFLPTQRLV